MRLSSSSFVAPSAVAILSTVLLWGPAASQTATPAAPLPTITVDAPKHVARPHRPPEHVANTAAPRRSASTARTDSSISHVAWGPPGSDLARLAAIERTSSNCTDGCQTSFKYGNQPWNGCSASSGNTLLYSPTCRNRGNYKTFQECRETEIFVSGDKRGAGATWYCTSLLAGGKLAGEKHEVAELTPSERPR
jgi:hypothetical protein